MTQKNYADSIAEKETPLDSLELQPCSPKKIFKMCSSPTLSMMFQLLNFPQVSMNRNFIKSQSCDFLILSNFSTNKKFKKHIKEHSKTFFNEFLLLYSHFLTSLKNEGFDEEPVIYF